MTDKTELRLGVSVSVDGTTVWVSVGGDVDVANADELRAVVMVAAEHAGPKRVVVDLSGVEFLGSHGVSTLVACHSELHAGGAQLEVLGARDGPLRVLEMTGVLHLLSPGRPPVGS